MYLRYSKYLVFTSYHVPHMSQVISQCNWDYTPIQFKWQLCISLFYPFWPLFYQLYVYLSQNWDADGRFEVLNEH